MSEVVAARPPRSDAASRILIGVPALAAVGMQTSMWLHDPDMPLYRAAAIGLGAAGAGWAYLARRPQIRSPLVRLLAGGLSSAVFWLAVLEMLLQRGPVLARGVLGLVGGGLAHAAAILVSTTPAHEPARAELVGDMLLAASAVVLTLFLVETALRTVQPVDVYEIVPDDPRAGRWWIDFPNVRWVPRPGFRGHYIHPEFSGSRVDINALGFRDSLDQTAPPGPGDRSLLVLGDSIVFGTGVDVEETFHRLLARRAREITVKPLRVYGAGVPGFGQLDELHYLEALAPRIRPDVVVAGLYEGNDLEDNLNGAAHAAGRANPPPSPGARSETWPVLVRFLAGITRSSFWRGSSATFQYAEPTIGPPLVRLGLLSPTVPTNQILDLSLLVPSPPVVEQALAVTRDALRAIDARCREIHAVLIVLVIPAAIQAEPARFDDFLATHRAAQRTGYSRIALHDRIVQMVRDLGIHVVDPLPRLTAEAVAGRPCYRREGHWNAAGHRLASDLLVPVLADLMRGKRPGSSYVFGNRSAYPTR